MAALRFRSPVTKPLLRAGVPKYLPPDPRAYDTFRVTQQFASPDAYWAERDIREGRPPRTHGAVDIGNFRCGDPVVAMHGGIGRRVQDNAKTLGAPSNALGYVIDHGHGITSEYWHLNRQDGPHNGAVAAGQRIGIVGSTGLGSVCHLHVEVKRNGTKIDPEPLMFGGSLTVEDDMDLPNGLLAVVVAALGTGNRLRVDPNTTDGSRIMEETRDVQILGTGITGASYTLGGRTSNEYCLIGVYGRAWYVAKPLLTNWRLKGDGVTMIGSADCSAEIEAVESLTLKLTRARTAVAGARNATDASGKAIDSALESLR